MMSFTDWNKKEKNYTITKGRNGLPLFVLPVPDILKKDDEPKLLDDEPTKKKEKTIPQMVSDFISIHNN